MKIVVGSKNPVKVESVRKVFKEVVGDLGGETSCEVVGVGVESGVPDQPWGDDEIIKGARNRAKGALETDPGAEFGVGLEGGVSEELKRMYSSAWCAVARKNGVVGVGGGMRFEIPEKMANIIRGGKEMGEVMDEFTKKENVKQKEGSIGVLTKNHTNRQKSYEQLVKYALVRFLGEEWFKD